MSGRVVGSRKGRQQFSVQRKGFSKNKQKHIVKEMCLKISLPMGERGMLSREEISAVKM